MCCVSDSNITSLFVGYFPVLVGPNVLFPSSNGRIARFFVSKLICSIELHLYTCDLSSFTLTSGNNTQKLRIVRE